MSAGGVGQQGANPINAPTTIYTPCKEMPELLQIELDYFSATPVKEERYAECQWQNLIASDFAPSDHLTFTYNPQGGFVRARTMAVTFEIANMMLPHPGPPPIQMYSNANIANGYGVTFWDTINLTVGTDQANCCPANNRIGKTVFCNWLVNVRKSREFTKLWWNAAGFFDIKCYDFLGGTRDGNSLTGCGAPPGNDYFTVAGQTPFYNPMTQGFGAGGIQLPTYNTTPAPYVCGSSIIESTQPGLTGNVAFKSRASECARFVDLEHQRMNTMFMGGGGYALGNGRDLTTNTCQSATFLVKLSNISSFYDVTTLLPPISHRMDFRISSMNQILHPRQGTCIEIRYPAAPARILQPTMAGVAQEFASQPALLTSQNAYLFYEELSLRSDIDAQVKQIWSYQTAFPVFFSWHETTTYEKIQGQSRHVAQIAKQGDMLPWKTAIGTSLTKPLSYWADSRAVGAGSTYDMNIAHQSPSFIFSDNGVSDITIMITEPTLSTTTRFTYRPFDRLPRNDWNYLTVMPRRGVLYPKDYWSQQIIKSGGFDRPHEKEIDSYNCMNYLPTEDGLTALPPGGFNYSDQVVANLTYGSYGMHSWFYKDDTTEAQGIGPHNLMYSWILHAQGIETEKTDFGTYFGHQTNTVQFTRPPYNPIDITYLRSYGSLMALVGTGNAELFFMPK